MLEKLTEAYDNLSPAIRRRYDKNTLEDASRQAAFVVNVAKELQGQVAVTDEVINTKWFDLYRSGDMNLEVMIQAMIHEKSPAFTPLDIPNLSDIATAHNESSSASAGIVGIPIATASLEQEEFDIFAKKLQFDLQVFKVYEAQCSDRKNSLHFQQVAYQLDRYKTIEKQAKQLFDPNSPTCQFQLSVAKKKTMDTFNGRPLLIYLYVARIACLSI